MIIIIKKFSFFLFPVGAIKREAGRLRDDWEVNLCSGGAASTPEAVSDTYCFEMMSLVLGNNIINFEIQIFTTISRYFKRFFKFIILFCLF